MAVSELESKVWRLPPLGVKHRPSFQLLQEFFLMSFFDCEAVEGLPDSCTWDGQRNPPWERKYLRKS